MILITMLFPLHTIGKAAQWNVPLPKVRAAADSESLRGIEQETTKTTDTFVFVWS